VAPLPVAPLPAAPLPVALPAAAGAGLSDGGKCVVVSS